MNLGQTMITIGMLTLLTVTVVSVNRMLMINMETIYTAEATTAAGSVAQDLLDEAMGKKFDATSDESGTQPVTAFTYANSLGPNSGEVAAVGTLPDSSYKNAFRSITGYSDFDDYNGYTRLATANGISDLLIRARVYYISEYDPETPSANRSYYKVIELTVTHPLYIPLDKPIKLSGMLSY